MELPIIEPAPVATERAAVFRDLFGNQCQFWQFQHYRLLHPQLNFFCVLNSAHGPHR